MKFILFIYFIYSRRRISKAIAFFNHLRSPPPFSYFAFSHHPSRIAHTRLHWPRRSADLYVTPQPPVLEAEGMFPPNKGFFKTAQFLRGKEAFRWSDLMLMTIMMQPFGQVIISFAFVRPRATRGAVESLFFQRIPAFFCPPPCTEQCAIQAPKHFHPTDRPLRACLSVNGVGPRQSPCLPVAPRLFRCRWGTPQVGLTFLQHFDSPILPGHFILPLDTM